MLGGEDTRNRGQRAGGALLVLIISKTLRASALVSAFSLLHVLPVFLYVFIVLAAAALMFIGFVRPWASSSKQLTSHQWTRLLLYSAVLVLNLVLWYVGLKYYGPVRTVLSSDYGDYTMYLIAGTFFASKAINMTKAQGAALIVLGYVILFFFGETPVIPPVNFGDESRYVYVGPIPIEEGKFGGFCLLISLGLTIARKSISRRLYGDIGGTKRLFSISTGFAALMLSPIAIYQFFSYDFELPFTRVLSLAVIAFNTLLLDYYVESTASQQMDTPLVVQVSMAVSFVVVSIGITWTTYEGAGWLSWICFGLIMAGTFLLFGKSGDLALPVYTQTAVNSVMTSLGGSSIMHRGAHPTQGFTLAAAQAVIRAILSKSASRRIFGFLVINLMFMFVELFYGILTNSLGLITDACHMLFDCMALFIALYAEVICMWDANQIYSYGYGRVQVLSGFTNGIFLVFVAFFVMMESIERFMEPPEIKTDKLLLVSVLGFLVNIVGVVSFHDHGGHSHGGHSEETEEHDHKKHDKHSSDHHGHEHKHNEEEDNSHSHDHGHSHSEHDHSHSHHNQQVDKPKKSKPKHVDHGGHSHSHGHSHGRSENLEGVFLHLLADTLGSVGVIISSFIIQTWGYTIADPICSLCIAVLIFLSTIPLIKNSSKTLLQRTPSYFEQPLEEVLHRVTKLEGVIDYRDPHFWAHSNDILVGTIHIHVDNNANEQKILQIITNMFKEQGVTYITVEIEKPSSSGKR